MPLIAPVSEQTRSEQGWLTDPSRGGRGGGVALARGWSMSDPERVGERAELPRGGAAVLGRGDAQAGDPGARLLFRQARPGSRAKGSPLASPGVSRVQLCFTPAGRGFDVESVGKAALFVDGVACSSARVSIGTRLYVERQLLLLVVDAGELSPRAPAPPFAFGEPDPHGFVGESPRAYALRDELAFLARRSGHVLVQGPSGAGKELCARALHELSPRARGPFVARNAATLPPGIIDAELFGNAHNYPNAGMRARRGLVGEADGGALFLDELAELPEELQAHLLRLLDAGEYHRLGDDAARRAELRLIGATNRDPAALKHDLLARLPLRVVVPGLDERLEDVPLLVRSILRRHAARDDELRHRFFHGAHPRVDPALQEALLTHVYSTHVRELEALLIASMAASRGNFLELGDAVLARLRPRASARATDPVTLTREELAAGLARAGGNVSQAWRLLGLSSRDALRRLMKKHAL